MTTLYEKFRQHLTEYNLKETNQVSLTHEFSHVILSLNGFTETNCSFRSEEMQIVLHMALFRDEIYRYGDNRVHLRILDGDLNSEVAQIKPLLDKVRKNIFLPWYRDLKIGEVIRDDYISQKPDCPKYTESGLKRRFEEGNHDDFMQFKLDQLGYLKATHRGISADTVTGVMKESASVYEGMLNEKEVFKIYDIGLSIRKDFYKKHSVHIDQIKPEKLGEMDYMNFISQKAGKNL